MCRDYAGIVKGLGIRVWGFEFRDNGKTLEK